jgi:hypothetical protein
LDWSLGNVEFSEYASGVGLVEMMSDEVLSDVLSLSAANPIRSSRMAIDVGSQVVEFVFENPETRVVSPELRVSLGFLAYPYI